MSSIIPLSASSQLILFGSAVVVGYCYYKQLTLQHEVDQLKTELARTRIMSQRAVPAPSLYHNQPPDMVRMPESPILPQVDVQEISRMSADEKIERMNVPFQHLAPFQAHLDQAIDDATLAKMDALAKANGAGQKDE